MSVTVDVNALVDREIAARLETSVIRAFSDRPRNEDWTVSVKPFGLTGYEVVVRGAGPVRKKLFLQDRKGIVAEIADWVGLYFPLASTRLSVGCPPPARVF